ncbi:hypothetical protein [Megalodesulfovibrio gigas]|uniref:Uncharacterized protein n=1 Tax=Megalodesulfovibrio gigas (strain ATCC 19364 / DSM 1382 / NCIMB 9332 / VKM B-1759) TaxID=1121448 RepID=T2G8F6_MEGG1|nr:hypothetical protein [Megalodesulfovibrio gigas]AGW12875.1 hypothetical protein DGI_0997 [Megalodesulfovibrio gigas DSM 1382 = ATCC 19364]
MDASTANIQAVAAAIDESLAAGMTLPSEVLAFLEGMTGEISAQALQALLDEDDSTGHSALELIFFPERALRNRLEPLLGEGFSPAAAGTLLDQVEARGRLVCLRFPDGSTLELAPPRWVLERMLSRMRLTRHIPLPLLDQLDAALGQNRALPYRTLLRNSRCAWSDENIAFMQAFLLRATPAPGQEARYQDLFRAALAFLEEAPAGRATYASLMDRKRFYHAALEKARQFQETAQGLPMEALISKGATPPVMTVEEALARIRSLDALSLTIYGRTDPLDSPTHEQHVPIDPDMLPEEE